MYAGIRMAASRVKGWFLPRTAEDREFDAELASHVEMLTEENIRRGMEPGEARRGGPRAARRAERSSRTNRELRGLPWLETLAQDVRYALRSCARLRDLRRWPC